MPPDVACIACNATREGSNCCKASSLIISFLINNIIKSSSENCVILGTLGNLIIGSYGLYCVFDLLYIAMRCISHPALISVILFMFFFPYVLSRRKEESPLNCSYLNSTLKRAVSSKKLIY